MLYLYKMKNKKAKRPSSRRLLRSELKLLASTLSRVLCNYESNSTSVVARSTRGDTCVGEDAGRLRVLMCNARLHWDQRDGVAMENSSERGHTLSVDTGRRGANCERRITLRGCTRENKGEKKKENERQ